MIITRLFISGYKNLLDCDFSPEKVHAITGCNGAGKSNMLEVLPFVAGLLSGSDEMRKEILIKGSCPNGSWFPISIKKEKIKPFQFTLECILSNEGVQHFVQYELKFESTDMSDSPYHEVKGAKISSETIKTKIVGASGIERTVLTRNSNAEVIAFGGKTKRAKTSFKCKSDMSALQALEVREADEFPNTYPILSQFRRALLSTELVRLDSESFRQYIYTNRREPFANKMPGAVINSYDPYHLLREIEKDAHQWKEFQQWLKHLVDLDGVELYESEVDKKAEPTPQTERKQFIFLRQHQRYLSYGELSMGGTVSLGYLTVLFTLLKKGGAAIFEEPENYLHPKAVVELIRLFREFSQEHTVIFSTHSPVALNSMKPQEVSVMRSVGDGFVTIKNVSDIKEAIDALNRGFLSFGDLLQTDYATK
jgi:predicted ATPase